MRGHCFNRYSLDELLQLIGYDWILYFLERKKAILTIYDEEQSMEFTWLPEGEHVKKTGRIVGTG